MLLTITYKGTETQNLGFLLYKHPDRAQKFKLNYGQAYVFYPEVSDERTTVALLMDIDPIDLAKGKLGSHEGGLFDYVNDRPYAATSFMSTAIAKVFGKAMSGRCEQFQELADTKLDLTASLYCLRDNGYEGLAKDLFEPLGYSVEIQRTMLDEKFPEWGNSPYIDLTVKGKVKLSDMLNHLYLLIPVFDKQKHYYTSKDELEKLVKHGEGWLEDHPAKNKILYRYFAAKKGYAKKASDMLSEEESVDEEEETAKVSEEILEKHISLNTMRMETVKNAVLESGAEKVIDIGCGEGKLVSMLMEESSIKKITACDVSVKILEKAAKRMRFDKMPQNRRDKLEFIQGSLTYRDKRFEGYDCACVIEVIEHIEPMRIPAFERVVFEFAKPKTVIVTTPNVEYNVNYENLGEGKLRHADHRFEWNREELKTWTEHICEKFGYSCTIKNIGEYDEKTGSPTQMGVFCING